MTELVVPAGEDPRKYGFNYGRGWGSSPKPPIYYEGDELAQHLRKIAQEASAKAWAVDHALWKVRIAEREDEKRVAITELEAIVASHQTIGVPD